MISDRDAKLGIESATKHAFQAPLRLVRLTCGCVVRADAGCKCQVWYLTPMPRGGGGGGLPSQQSKKKRDVVDATELNKQPLPRIPPPSSGLRLPPPEFLLTRPTPTRHPHIPDFDAPPLRTLLFPGCLSLIRPMSPARCEADRRPVLMGRAAAAKKRRSGAKRVMSRGKRGRVFKKTIATPTFDPDMPHADPFADDPLSQAL